MRLGLSARVWNHTGLWVCLKPGIWKTQKFSAAKNPKAYMIYVYKGHKECRGFPLWRANRCRTHLYLKGLRGWDRNTLEEGFWTHRKNINRHVTSKHREIAAPVHVKDGGEGSPPPFWKQRGRGERKSTPDRKRKCKGSKRKKTGLGDLILSFSNEREKFKNKKLRVEKPGALSTRQRAFSGGTTWARDIAARTRPKPRPRPLPSARKGEVT